MEANITDQQTFGVDLQLAEPHFDDEATLLSARPVVPLRAIRQQARSARHLAFGLAIVVALMVGALGATLIYKQRGQKTEPAIVETTTNISEPTSPAEPPSSEVGGAAIESDEPKPSIAENEAEVTTQKARNAGAAKMPATLVSQSVESAKKATRRDETLNKKDRKDMRRADRFDARSGSSSKHQAVREARREARARQSSNGLWRIREIFEGSPRP
jgi:type IV secretory pathway VirB10-like protein